MLALLRSVQMTSIFITFSTDCMPKAGTWMGYRPQQGKEIVSTSIYCERNGRSSLHIAVTQLHTQPGVIEQLIEDTREAVAAVLKSDNKNDTPTVTWRRSLVHWQSDSPMHCRPSSTVPARRFRTSHWSATWLNCTSAPATTHTSLRQRWSVKTKKRTGMIALLVLFPILIKRTRVFF